MSKDTVSNRITGKQLREAVPDHLVKEWVNDVINEFEWMSWSEKDRATLECCFWSVVSLTLDHIAPLVANLDPGKDAA